MLQRGDTSRVFQLESSGMTALVIRMKPDCFEDLIALVFAFTGQDRWKRNGRLVCKV